MWYRIFREIMMEFYWIKKDIIRRWRLDTPVGVMGIIAIVSGITLSIFICQVVAKIIRGAIPWVAGSTVGALYWSSIGLALKVSFIFIIFCSSLILYFLLKIYNRS
jgi:hypothetical protein